MEISKLVDQGTNSIKIKLAVDRTRNRVLFVDAGSDFLDVLLSFLTLPLSALQFCAGESSPGCLSSLCESVNHLRESKLLKVEACHGMLLCPRHVQEFNLCNSPDRKPCCYNNKFVKNQPSLQAQNPHCSCWEVMSRLVHVYNQASGSALSRHLRRFPYYNEVFLKGKERFVISDDWVIKPASTSSILALLRRIDADLEKGFEEAEVIVSWAQVVSMLKSSLSSEAVFSDTFLSKETDDPVNPETKLGMSPKQEFVQHPSGKESDPLPQMSNVKLFFNKREKRVMYAECKHDFVDMLFSLLVYPVNCAIQYMGGGSCFSSNFRNLYRSAIDLETAGFLTGSPSAKKMLLEPSLAPFRMGYQARNLDPGENTDPEFISDLFSGNLQLAMDRVYVVEDSLLIHQASAMAVAKHWCGKDKEVLEADVTMSKEEAVALVRSVATSKTVLTAFGSRI